ncbi:MATE family efflux transporter [Paraferrimonas haliotis]|uniref:Multidrug-efflux transporter n=1 Tax=Paraferrimonas haliotis TaxID=2013866 RepID=A0AA37TYA6_9GAMM|nr:MATE family efflux transporter [Paraferrimonas haliotis]GLS84520.1 putative multidrug resistance protein NorM [Paraferrimonas haliotis]
MSQFSKQLTTLIKLATPILIAQVTQTMMGLIDTVMAGRVSALDMAAVAVGSSLWLPIVMFLTGILMAITPLVANADGENRRDKVAPIFVQGCYLALICAVIAVILLNFSPILLGFMDIETDLTALASDYVFWIALGAPAYAVYQVMRNTSEGVSYTLPTMIIGFVGLAVNIPANYIFINGHLGMPAMGGAGCGLATALVYWAMFIAMGLYIAYNKRLKQLKLFTQMARMDWRYIGYLTKLGTPVAMSLFMEVALFAAVAILIAPLGTTVVAGHQVAINFSSIIFMLPLSIGIAASIRVGYFMGKGAPHMARYVTKLALFTGLVIAGVTGVITVWLRVDIASLYTNDAEVIAIAASLLFFAALYQLSDAVQVVCAGALRGYKDMNAIFVITFISYLLVGLPTGCILGLTDWLIPAMGAAGFWVGFITGLTTAGALLGARVLWLQNQLKRLNA